MCRFNVILKKPIEDTYNNFFFYHEYLDSTPQVYYSVSEMLNNSILD